MYLPDLIDLARTKQEISAETLAAVDAFLGAAGEGSLFTRDDLAERIPQRECADIIVNFLIEKEAVTPYRKLCPSCGRELPTCLDVCDECDEVLPAAAACLYRIEAKLRISDSEKRYKNDDNQQIDLSAFRILKAKIDRKKKTREPASILFFDIANSTALTAELPSQLNTLKYEFMNFIKTLGLSYLRSYKGHYLKSDGDSSYVYVDDPRDVLSFMFEYCSAQERSPFYNIMLNVNKTSRQSRTYIKIYHSASPVIEYTIPDLLTLDFTGMEAFVMNQRIEKQVKTLLTGRYSEERLFPFFFCSTMDLPRLPSTPIHLDNVDNYNTADCRVSFMQDFASVLSSGNK